MSVKTLKILLAVSLLAITLISCSEEEKVPPPYQPTDAYDAYLHGLETTKISGSALGKDWIAAGENAMNSPVEVPVPYSEMFYLPEDQPTSLGVRFSAKKGQVIDIKIDSVSEDVFLFIDLFRIENDSLGDYKHVATADSAYHQLQFEPRKDSEYILRIIPEILRGGNYIVTIANLPLLAFPVSGKDKWAIQSKFGAPREGGRREHHGVDIFARRHTPIIAPVDGVVRKIDTAKLGGRVIWLRDERRNNLYFAHLQEQWVTTGEKVQAGDTIGTVGNTGNARTTPPHLHFGIYSRGPVDPWNYIVAQDTVPDEISADHSVLGQWIRNRQKVSLRTHYGTKFDVTVDYEPNTPLYVEGIAGKYYRVRQVDGSSGYVLARVFETIDHPIRELVVDSPLKLHKQPGTVNSNLTVNQGEVLSVVGKYEDYLMVRTSSGILGWTEGQ